MRTRSSHVLLVVWELVYVRDGRKPKIGLGILGEVLLGLEGRRGGGDFSRFRRHPRVSGIRGTLLGSLV